MDKSIICLLKQGDQQAFNQVFEACYERVYRYAYTFSKDQEAAKEIVQEAFVQLWINREKIDENVPIYACLFAKAKWLAIEAYRKRLVAQKYEQEMEQLHGYNSIATEGMVSWNELNQLISETVHQLPKQQQQVFEMSRFEGLSYEEIGERLHISKNTVKYHLVNALKTIRGQLEAHGVFFALPLLYLLIEKF